MTKDTQNILLFAVAGFGIWWLMKQQAQAQALPATQAAQQAVTEAAYQGFNVPSNYG